MSLKISKASHWNASFYSFSPAKIYATTDQKKTNFDDFLQSIVTPYILLCSVGNVYFEGKIVY